MSIDDLSADSAGAGLATKSGPAHHSDPPWQEPAPRPIQVLKVVIISLIVLLMAGPFVYVILTSLASRSSSGHGVLPSDYSFDAYRSLLAGGVVTRALLVSIGVTVVGTVLSVLFTVLLAFGLVRTREMPGGRAILFLILATMLFNAGIIPNYLLVKQLGLLNSYWSLILPTLISAFNLVVVRSFFMQLPTELYDAARIDGASEWRLLWQVVMPLSKAVIAVIGLFYAVGYWNSFFTALLYINDTSKWPIQLVLNTYVLQGSPLSQIQNPDIQPPARAIQMAVVVMATLPVLIVYPFVQRFFTKGVLTGAIKG
ncbi:carbohydrate ABC transporter permease [Microlunatus soli]|uniref:Putative aldouronate transport system permease protein n=1 Tax=Microlunatus soli TaxID=630515 RepID=A0A1H1YL58_9ACTN|nr:carbohydrate ABC transporter permease [Microlunatus soli]SDT22173.1 putative aldouronate transport system permease protein [Microlunatus soli]